MREKKRSQSITSSGERSPLLKAGSDDDDVCNIEIEQNTQEAGGAGSSPLKEKARSTFSFKALSREKKLTFVAMAFANFAACTSFSLLAPFFPHEASQKGASQTVVGLIFSTFELWIFISAPLFGYFMLQIGSQFMFKSGLFVCGGCSVLFGLLDKSPPGTTFVTLCFLVRSLEALGASAFVTASFAIIANEFPDHVSTAFGVLETFSGLGMMVGPPIGGILYEWGGFSLPFFMLGGLLVLCSFLTIMLMPWNPDIPSTSKASVLRMLASPLVLVTSLTVLSGSFCLGFMDPTLADHLAEYGLNTALVGLVFIVAPAIYALTAPLWGYLSDDKGYHNCLIIFGNALTTLSFLLIGPSPLLPVLKKKLWLVIVALAVAGFGLGSSMVCTLKCLLIGAKGVGFEDSLETFGIVSGLFNSVFSLGTFVGPTVGSVIVQHQGFDWASTATAGLACFATVAFILYLVLHKSCQWCGRGKQEEKGEKKGGRGGLTSSRAVISYSTMDSPTVFVDGGGNGDGGGGGEGGGRPAPHENV